LKLRRGEREHARWRRGSGPGARPSTTVLRVIGGAISTIDRRSTTRPCNLSRFRPSPRRCAARLRHRTLARMRRRHADRAAGALAHQEPIVAADQRGG
jgi:hypothetical protein